MIITIWNIRGLNQAHKQEGLKSFLSVNKVDIIGVLETRVKEHKAKKILAKVAKGWKVQCNYAKAVNGRIRLLWKPHIQVSISTVTDQFIQCMIEDVQGKIRIHLSVVYAHNTAGNREQLWCD